MLKGEDEGVVVEFVNPKYKAGSRTEFKKPTRLECMMQDFPKLMSKELGDAAKVHEEGCCSTDEHGRESRCLLGAPRVRLTVAG